MSKLYFLSDKNMDGKTLTPRIPDNFFTKNGYEDKDTPRVCFAPSIGQALMALSRRFEDQILYVHTPDSDIPIKDIHIPSTKEVPDSKITGEVWVLKPVKIKTVSKIRVTKDAGKAGHKFKYGDKTAELYDWEYSTVKVFKESVNDDLKEITNALSKDDKHKLNLSSGEHYEPNVTKAFIEYDKGKPVAYFTITKADEDIGGADVSLAVLPEYQGKGYGSKVAMKGCKWIKDHLDEFDDSIYWATRPNNIASQKIAEKNGFKVVRDDDKWKTYAIKGSKVNKDKLYRFTIGNTGVYEGFKHKVSPDVWKSFISNKSLNGWLKNPGDSIYKSNKKVESYFTKNGYEKFLKLVMPEIKKYVSNVKLVTIDEDIVLKNHKLIYDDEYQKIFIKK